MHNPFRNRFAAVALAGAVGIATVGGATLVMAGESGGPGPTAAAVLTAQDAPGEGTAGRCHHDKRSFAHVGLKSVIEASGLDPSVFREGFAAGQSANQILEANGLDPAAIKAEVLAEFEAKLDEKVGAGELTQEEADRLLQKASEMLDRLMAATPGAHDATGDRKRHAGIVFKGIDAAAEAIGITTAELGEALKGGSTIAQVAESHGVSPATVVDALVADFEAGIQAQLDAGKIDGAQADRLRTNLRDRMEKLVNEGHSKPGLRDGERKPGALAERVKTRAGATR